MLATTTSNPPPRVRLVPFTGEAPRHRVPLGTLGLASSGHAVERKPHPDGWAGVVHSLQKVQKMAAEGMVHPTVRAVTIEVLKQSGNPKDDVSRAKAILAWMRKERIWVPDPVNTEMMQGAHLTLGGVFKGGDCDDLTIATLAAYLSCCSTVGAQAAVVGHAYGSDREVTHVLGAILDGNTWHYVEPSTTKVEFGDAYAPTREVVLWVPGDGKIACDADRCLTGGRAAMPRHERATFVGINGVGASGVGAAADEESALDQSGDPSVLAPPSVLNPETSAGISAWVLALLQDLESRRDELLRAHEALHEIARIQGVDKESGPGWTPEDTDRTRNLVVAGDFYVRALTEVLTGKRKFYFATGDKGYGFEKFPSDPEITIDVDKKMVVVKAASHSIFQNGTLGVDPVVTPAATGVIAWIAAHAVTIFITVTLIGLGVIAIIYAYAKVIEWQTQRAKEEARIRIVELYSKCLTSPDCTPEQRELIGRAYGKAAQGLQPAGASPLDVEAGGAGSGYGWSWLGWPVLIGIATVGFLAVSREYVRLANRSRRIRRRDSREVKDTAEEARRASRPSRVRRGRAIAVDPSTGESLFESEEEDTSSFWGAIVRAWLCSNSSSWAPGSTSGPPARALLPLRSQVPTTVARR